MVRLGATVVWWHGVDEWKFTKSASIRLFYYAFVNAICSTLCLKKCTNFETV